MTSRKLHIDITPRTFHFKQPARTSRGVYTTRRSWFVTITPAGVEGEPLSYALSGECAPLPDLSCDAIPHYETTLRDLCKLIEHTNAIDDCIIVAFLDNSGYGLCVEGISCKALD